MGRENDSYGDKENELRSKVPEADVALMELLNAEEAPVIDASDWDNEDPAPEPPLSVAGNAGYPNEDRAVVHTKTPPAPKPHIHVTLETEHIEYKFVCNDVVEMGAAFLLFMNRDSDFTLGFKEKSLIPMTMCISGVRHHVLYAGSPEYCENLNSRVLLLFKDPQLDSGSD